MAESTTEKPAEKPVIYPLEGILLRVEPGSSYHLDDRNNEFNVAVRLDDNRVVVVKYFQTERFYTKDAEGKSVAIKGDGYTSSTRKNLYAILVESKGKRIGFNTREQVEDSKGEYTGVGLVKFLDAEKRTPRKGK